MNKFFVSAALVIIGAFLAFSGYVELLTRTESGVKLGTIWFESALRTLAMLTSPFAPWTLGIQGLKEMPWQMQLARVLFPVGILSGTVALVYEAFGRELRAFRARFASDHVVVCGLGDPAWNLTVDLITQHRRKVVAVDLNADRSLIERYHRAGVPVLTAGDRVDEPVLRRAALRRAKAIVALSESDLVNLEIMLAAQHLKAKERPGGRGPLVGRANVVEADMRETCGILLDAHPEALVYGTLSAPRNTVRQLLGRFPLHLDPEVRRGGRIHVSILGFGRTGQELALEVARSAHYADFRAPLISVLDREAKACLDAFLVRHPGVRHAAELHAIDMDLQIGRSSDGSGFESLFSHDRPSRVVICFSAGRPNLGAAVAFRAECPDLPIYIRLSDAPEIARTLRDGIGRMGIRPFGDAASLFTKDVVLDESLDVLAHAAHENYLEMMQSAGVDLRTLPARRAWERLPETFREASRHQADHIAPKLHAIGCEIVAAGPTEPFRFRDDEVELLARMEHARWCAERFVAGWRHAQVRNDSRREIPSLVPWGALSESEREKDRAVVRSIPKILASAGRMIRRTESASHP